MYLKDRLQKLLDAGAFIGVPDASASNRQRQMRTAHEAMQWLENPNSNSAWVQWPPLDEFASEAERYKTECQGVVPMVVGMVEKFKRQRTDPIVDAQGFVRKVAKLEFNYEGNQGSE